MLAISARMRPTSGKATLHTDELPASAVTDAAMLQAVHEPIRAAHAGQLAWVMIPYWWILR